MIALLLLAAGQMLQIETATIELVRDRPTAYLGSRLRLCGEVTPDRAILFSDTHLRFHGRVGVRLQGFNKTGRNRCLLGRLLRQDGTSVDDGRPVLVSDAPVPPGYVFVREPD